MAKTNPNDRNAVAVQKRKEASARKDTWVADDGRVIKLKDKPDLVFIQQASASVEIPETPTYDVKVGQTVRSYPLDPVVIKQTDDETERRELQLRWTVYQFRLGEALGEQTKRTTGAMFMEGTVADEEMVDNDVRWVKRMKVSGWPIPKDPEEKWVLYLQTSLDEPQIKSITAAIVRRAGGVSEEQIAAAEEMFRDIVPADEESRDLENVGADSEGVGR